MGRRPVGVHIVDQLDGSADAKKRLRLILEALAGERTAQTAGQLLGISRRRFDALRRRFLRLALDSLEPRPPGRQGRKEVEDGQLATLQAQVQRLQIDLRAAQVREEIALAMPNLLRRRLAGKKARPARGRRIRSSTAAKPVT